MRPRSFYQKTMTRDAIIAAIMATAAGRRAPRWLRRRAPPVCKRGRGCGFVHFISDGCCSADILTNLTAEI
jgi:hypothetical protein